MFACAPGLEVDRLIAAAPDWPTLDEMWAEYLPTPPPADGPGCGDGPVVHIGVPVDVDPSGWLAVELDVATDEPRALSEAELIDALAGLGRVETWAQARQARLVAEFDRRRPGSASRFAPDEIALALSVSRFVAVGLIDRARRLVDTLHDTLAAFDAGRVDAYKVRLICDAVRYLDDGQAVWVQDRVLPRAATQSAAQLRAALARAVIAVDPEGANERHRRARRDRRVGIGPETDGMATLWASLSAQDAQSVFGTLTGLARALGVDDPRGMDARRADLLVGLTTGELSITFATSEPSDTPNGGDNLVGGNDTADDDTASHDAVEHGAVADPITGGPITDRPADDGPTRDDPTAAERAAEQRTGDCGQGGGEGDAATGAVIGQPGPGDARSSSGEDPPGQRSDTDQACSACAAEAWRASRPRLRPVNPAKPLVQVLIAHSTLRGIDHAPAELIGHGAICAEQAREIAADAVWRRLVHDDETGALLDHGRTTYRPPAALADHVRARDMHCRSPLCRRRALDCELDHTVPYPLGPTADHNLTAGCALHHHEKHSPGWTVLHHLDGRVDWITPTGHVYSSQIHDHRPLPSPPPPPSLPGPVADRTDAQPQPPTPAARVPRVRYDWAEGPCEQNDDPPPF